MMDVFQSLTFSKRGKLGLEGYACAINLSTQRCDTQRCGISVVENRLTYRARLMVARYRR